MTIFHKLSLKTKLIGMVFGVICALGGGAIYDALSLKEEFIRQTLNRLGESANNISDPLAEQLYERYGDVQAFALNPNVRSMNGRIMQADLEEYVKLYGIYDVILVVDRSGRFVAANSADSSGKPVKITELRSLDFSSAPWFKAAIGGSFTEDKSKGFAGTYFENPHNDVLSRAAMGESRIAAGFTSVIKDESGHVVGVVTNRSSMKWISDVLVTRAEMLYESGFLDTEVTLTDEDGFVMMDAMREGEKYVVKIDPATFGKRNIVTAHVPAGKLALESHGGTLSMDQADGESDLVGYAHTDGPKWPGEKGWAVLVHDSQEDALKSINESMFHSFIVFGLTTVIALIFATWLSLKISGEINSLSTILGKSASELAQASQQVATSSQQLSEGSTEQAAALQETVAAVDEINAMVDRNAEAAGRSKESSAGSREAALRGRQNVDQMIQAIGEISSSNDEVSQQMTESNQQLNEITKLINDIGSKTRVINEIVFQTKLLSFNASVEAARAGEYGKGFAVVAEEVGNLAQMSGNAAKEISTLLDQSIERVTTIVNESKSKVERLMNDSRQRVDAGAETARSCNEALEEILSQVSAVDTLVSEIATASQEQATGIREIAKAVGQMETVTQQNSAVAEQSSSAAEQLKGQSTQLADVVSSLTRIISGAGGHAAPSAGATVTARAVRPSVKNKILKFAQRDQTVPVTTSSQSTVNHRASGDDFAPSSDNEGFNE